MHTINSQARVSRNKPRDAVKSALRSVLGAASRLHHYRDIHTRMVYKALSAAECTDHAKRCDDE